MRILLLGDCNNPHIERWCGALRRRNHDVHLFSFTAPRVPGQLPVSKDNFWSLSLEASFPMVGRTSARKLSYFRAIPLLRRVWRKVRPDVVNAHYAASYGLIAVLSRVGPLAVSVWGNDIYDWPRHSPIHNMLMRYTLRSAGVVLSTSKVMAGVTARYTSRPILVTPFGVDTRLFSPHGEHGAIESDQPFVIGTVKALEEKYGIKHLVEAVRLIQDECPQRSISLHIYGDGSQAASLAQLAAKLAIQDIVRFHGRIPNSQVSDVLRQMHIVVLPSVLESESFGVAAIEAQACGIPVIASNVGGLSETVVAGKTGLIVPVGDSAAIARAVITLMGDEALRSGMGRAGRKHVLEHYSLEKCVEVMEQAYRTVTRSERPGI